MEQEQEQHRLRVPNELLRGAERRQDAAIDQAVWLIRHMCEDLELADLSESAVLDVGCGVKFTQAFLNKDIPVKRYVGVDVNREVIEYLQSHVHDPRFEFMHLNARNALYNPDGIPMAEEAVLPLPHESFDVLCLFSVFTHLGPDDYRPMLRLLRRFASASSRLYYTLFLNEVTETGHGLVDSLSNAAATHPELISPADLDRGDVPDFVDMNPADPLRWAVYSREYARKLVEGTGWSILSVRPPAQHLQHHIICAAV